MMEFLKSRSIFQRSNRLLKGVIYNEIENGDGFILIKSRFKDAWYNFVVPTVVAEDFPMDKARSVIEEEKANGVEVSLYVHESLADGLKAKFELEDFGSDVFMTKRLEDKFEDIAGELVEVDETNLGQYISMAKQAFPDWDNEEEYSRYFYELGQKKEGDKVFKSYLLKVDGQLVSFGSVIVSSELGLAYLHNTGTLEKYRHRGYYSAMVEHRCNFAFDLGVEEVYALVEDGGGSYRVLEKLGFEPEEKFNIFTLS